MHLSCTDRRTDRQTDRREGWQAARQARQFSCPPLQTTTTEKILPVSGAYGEIRFGDVYLSIGVRVGSNCSVNQRRCGLPASPATC